MDTIQGEVERWTTQGHSGDMLLRMRTDEGTIEMIVEDTVVKKFSGIREGLPIQIIF